MAPLIVLAGDAEQVARQLPGVLRPEVGSVTIRPHCVEGESVEDVIRSFAAEVMPRVERLTRANAVGHWMPRRVRNQEI